MATYNSDLESLRRYISDMQNISPTHAPRATTLVEEILRTQREAERIRLELAQAKRELEMVRGQEALDDDFNSALEKAGKKAQKRVEEKKIEEENSKKLTIRDISNLIK